MTTDNNALWNTFFSLRTVGELRAFAAQLDPSVPEQAALSYYIGTWPETSSASDDDPFAPNEKLSLDRSAIMYGRIPVIFEGSNMWSSKPHFTVEQLNERLTNLEKVVSRVRESNTNAKMALVLIPEKDHVISRFLLKENRFDTFERAIGALAPRMSAMGISLLFDQPFRGIEKFQTLEDFEYKDSHLPGRNYIIVFGFILERLGIPWQSVRSGVSLKKLPEYGDLATKFANGTPAQTRTFQPDVPQASVVQHAGEKTFADPLGDTWQSFRNDAALVDQSVCLLGDSHCSIYSQRKLGYLFASTFRETRFEWNPCGLRKKPDVASFDNVVLEISSRFVV